jgi:predicted nucleic acid-binding protein
VACKWYLDEVLSEAARRLLIEDIRLAVPRFFFLETCSVMAKRHRRREMTADDVQAVAESLERLPLNVWPDSALQRDALQSALRYRLSVYDAMYLALADTIDGRLVTADQRLVKAAAGSGWAARLLWLGGL